MMIYFGNLTHGIEEEFIRRAIYHQIPEITVIMVRLMTTSRGRSRGFAFVEIPDAEAAIGERLMAIFDGHTAWGRKVRCRPAAPKRRRKKKFDLKKFLYRFKPKKDKRRLLNEYHKGGPPPF